MALIDTHAHIHFTESYTDIDEVLERSHQAGVEAIINVGVTPADSRAALKLARSYWRLDKDGTLAASRDGRYPKLYAAAGLHPHEAAQGDPALDLIHDMAEEVIAIGECGLDYFKNHATKSEQDRALRAQLEIAEEHNLPVIFHVRDAWDEFFTVLNDHPRIRGVIHSFTGHQREVETALSRGGLCFGVNGIMTFTKDEAQLEAVRFMPADTIVFETDCPYLTPAPHRGKRNEPAYLEHIHAFITTLRGDEASELARQTTANAIELFDLEDR